MSTVRPSGASGSSSGRASGGITVPGAIQPGSIRRERAGRSGSARGIGGTGGAGQGGPSMSGGASQGGPSESGGTGGTIADRGSGGALGVAGPLLRLAVGIAIVLYLWRLTPTFGANVTEWLSYCDTTGQDLSCLTAEPMWRYLLWPLTSVFAAIALLRGAGVEGSKRPGHSVALALAALGALAASMIWGLS